MANKQAWGDFSLIIRKIDGLKNDIKGIINYIKSLEDDKVEMLDNPRRKGELKKIIDIHPDYSIDGISDDYSKLVALKKWLIDKGYDKW